MKLCDIAQAYHPSSGGIKTYLDAKRAAAHAAGIEHVLIVPGTRDSTVRYSTRTVHTVASLPIPGCAPYRLLARPNRLIAILCEEQPDIIEVDSPYVAPWAALWYRRRFGGAVVAFHHTDVADAYVTPRVRRWLGPRAAQLAARATLAYQSALYRRCDLVLTASHAAAHRLRAAGAPRVAVTNLGVDADTFHPSRRSEALRTELGVAPDAPLLIYAGRLDSEKRPDLVAAAFRRLPSELRAHLVFIGDGPLAGRLVDEATRAPGIHVFPYQSSRRRLAMFLASADIYVSAAPYETFGLAVLEAQAAGLAVAGVRSGAMVARVPAELGRLAPPGNPDALADAILALWREAPAPYGARARRLVEAHFSWGRTFERLFPLYRHVFVTARSSFGLVRPAYD